MKMSDTSITIRRGFARLAGDDYLPLVGVPTCFIVDAQGRKGALDHRIRPVTTATKFVGSALTIRCRPADNLAALVALDHIEPGDVLVIATGGHEAAAIVGDNFAKIARDRGAIAMVADGVARDIDDLEALNMPIFARGITPNSPHKSGPGEVGLPVSAGGVVVHPGDVVAADRDGVVIVPRETIGDVIAAAKAVQAREAAMAEAIVGGAMPEALAGVIANASIRYVD